MTAPKKKPAATATITIKEAGDVKEGDVIASTGIPTSASVLPWIIQATTVSAVKTEFQMTTLSLVLADSGDVQMVVDVSVASNAKVLVLV